MCRYAAFLLVGVLAAPACGQVRPARLGLQGDNLFGVGRGLTPLALSNGLSSNDYDSRAQMRRRMFEERRAKEQERREKSRKMVAFGKVLSEEELAKAKYNLAHI